MRTSHPMAYIAIDNGPSRPVAPRGNKNPPWGGSRANNTKLVQKGRLNDRRQWARRPVTTPCGQEALWAGLGWAGNLSDSSILVLRRTTVTLIWMTNCPKRKRQLNFIFAPIDSLTKLTMPTMPMNDSCVNPMGHIARMQATAPPDHLSPTIRGDVHH